MFSLRRIRAIRGITFSIHLAVTTVGVFAGQGDEPPANPFLADSPWPMSHRNPYNQASSPFAGPTTAGNAEPQFLEGAPVPITLAVSSRYPDGRRVVWGTTLEQVVKVDISSKGPRYVDCIPRPQSREEALSGAYSVLDVDGNYFVPRGMAIEAYRDVQANDADSPIEKFAIYEVPQEHHHAGDAIVGISMTYDGYLAFVTRRGLVGCVSRDFTFANYLSLATPGADAIEVSNSIAVDETGGIFITTDQSMLRVDWRPASPVGRLQLAWETPYRTTGRRAAGRLGCGSGTTPTLMGWGSQDQFVVIGDGQALMHLVLFWRGDIPDDWAGLPGRDRRIAAEIPVTFGDATATQSTTEQSLTVRGHEIVTVSNRYGPLPRFMRRFAKRWLGNDLHNATIYRSNHPEVAPYGVEKFAWDPQRRQLKSVWVNAELSCPNGIPTMSAATGLLYCIGQRDGDWTLEGIDWHDGHSVFHRRLRRHTDNNSFYAATELIGHGHVMTGTFGGMLRFGSGSEPVASIAARR